MCRTVFVALGVLLLIPLGSADPGFGTETAPELSDPAGNVAYSPAYVHGPKDHDYLDILAAWYESDPSGTSLVLTLKLSDLTQLASPEPEWTPWCELTANVTDGRATLAYHVGWRDDGSGLYGRMFVSDDGQWTDRGYYGVPGQTDIVNGTTFRAVLEQPGYLVLGLPIADYLKFGPGLEDFWAVCGEQYQPIETFGSIPIYNSNIASSEGRFDIPPPAERGSDAGDEPNLAGDVVSPTSSSPATRSSALGLGAILTALGAVVAGRRRS